MYNSINSSRGETLLNALRRDNCSLQVINLFDSGVANMKFSVIKWDENEFEFHGSLRWYRTHCWNKNLIIGVCDASTLFRIFLLIYLEA